MAVPDEVKTMTQERIAELPDATARLDDNIANLQKELAALQAQKAAIQAQIDDITARLKVVQDARTDYDDEKTRLETWVATIS